MPLPVTPAQIAALSPEERLELIDLVWETIDEQSEPIELNDELKRELDRRLAAHAANPDDVISWEEVKARAMERRRG